MCGKIFELKLMRTHMENSFILSKMLIKRRRRIMMDLCARVCMLQRKKKISNFEEIKMSFDGKRKSAIKKDIDIDCCVRAHMVQDKKKSEGVTINKNFCALKNMIF